MTKTIKLALGFADDDLIPYKDLCKELFEMQYLTAKACNRVMTYLYADIQKEFIMKENGDEVPKAKDMYGKSRKAYLYDKIKEVMVDSHTGNVSQTESFVESQFATDVKKGLLKGDVSLTNFRRDCAIHIHNKSYQFIETDKGIGVRISLFNKRKTKEMGLKTGQLTFMLPRVNKYQKAILMRMMSGEYKQGAGTLTYNKKKKKWMFGMSFTFEEKEREGNNTLIVRLGEDVLMRLRVRDGKTQELSTMKRYDDIVPGLEELQAVQRKMFAMRRSYGNSTRVASANNSGKGYRKRAEKVIELGKKESRFRNTFNHKISRYVVDIAKRYDCGLIELEDFSKTENAAFGDWTYYDLESKIVYKAKEKGIEVMETTTKEEAV